MASKQPISGADVKHAGGTIVNGGNVSSGSDNNVIGTTELSTRHKFIDVVTSSTVKKSISAGDFGNIHAGSYIIIGVTSTIAGVANTSILSPGSLALPENALHYGKGENRVHITDVSFLTGAATYGGSAGDRYTYLDPSTGSTIGSEVEPTRSVPGKFTYTLGNTPIDNNYLTRD